MKHPISNKMDFNR